MKNKKLAPEILTGKDLDYLKDIFGWNYVLYKLGENSKGSIEDKEIVKLFNECDEFFYDNLKIVLNILGGKYE